MIQVFEKEEGQKAKVSETDSSHRSKRRAAGGNL
jgi:hypothetical protein